MRFECPNCNAWLNGPTNRLHNCPGLKGLCVYFVPVGTKAKVEAVEREDYIGRETVPMTDGRPVMAVVTTRDDGQDTIVYAPTATGTGAMD